MKDKMHCTKCQSDIEESYRGIEFFERNEEVETYDGRANLCPKCYTDFEKNFIKFLG